MTKKNTAGQQDLSWVHTALESLSGKNGDPKHGSVLFRRRSMAHMALGHPDNAFEFAAVEKISHCQRGVPASCGWAELCSLWGWQTLGDGIPCSATCMSRMSDVSNTLMDTTTANHTNPKINKNTVSILAHVAAYKLLLQQGPCCLLQSSFWVAAPENYPENSLPVVLLRPCSWQQNITTQVWCKRVSFWLNRSIHTGPLKKETSCITSSECEIKPAINNTHQCSVPGVLALAQWLQLAQCGTVHIDKEFGMHDSAGVATLETGRHGS